MEALSGGSAVAGLVSLAVHLFDGCVKGFVLFSATRDQGSRAAIVNCQLEWEHFNLFSWALAVGLLKNPPELNAPNLPLIQKTLENLHQLLSDTQHLREVYKLDVQITAEELNSLDASKSHAETHNRWWRQFVTNTARVYQKRTSAWKKLRWAALDRDHFSQFLQDIHFFNEQLRNNLHWHDRQTCAGSTTEAIEAIVATTEDKLVLDAVIESWKTLEGSLRACAALRKDGLLLDAVNNVNASHHTVYPPRYQNGAHLIPAGPIIKFPDPTLRLTGESEQGQLSSDDTSPSLQKADYEGRPVFLEWKNVFDIRDRRLRHRVASVAGLLTSIEDPTFHSLKCIGYVKDTENQRYGYIFRPPSDDTMHARSLQYLLANGRSRPSLQKRLEIAIALNEAIRQLHNAGWLHKSVQPKNMWFFSLTWQTKATIYNLPNVYIGGYSFTRADRLTEMTEDPTQEHLLYRHPLSIDHDRVPYCKAFDLYSLGCVLLEIGLWQPLSDLYSCSSQLCRPTSVSTAFSRTSGTGQIPNAGQTGTRNKPSDRHLILNEILKEGPLAHEVRFSTGESYLKIIRESLVLADHIDDENFEELVFDTHLRHLNDLRALHERL